MKITKMTMGQEDVVLSEDARDILLELGNSQYILRQRSDNTLVLITPDGGFVQNMQNLLVDSGLPVRRTYFEPFSKGGMLIYQQVFDKDEDENSSD